MLKKLVSILVVVAFVASSSYIVIPTTVFAAGPLTEEWVARYNGPGNLNDQPSALAVDSSGNVYVTGKSYVNSTTTDYATIKYDSNGLQIWEARYNGSGNAQDYSVDLAIDDSGNVYVTGYSVGSGTNYDYATIKYDNNGNEEWVSRYNGVNNSIDQVYALAIDGSGNVYITGRSYVNSTTTDYATIKYDNNGNELWVVRYDGPGNLNDQPSSLAVDGSGNVYVTGSSYGIGTNPDYATIKYDSNGVQQWVTRYVGPGHDYATKLVIDGSGNVYVTGGSDTNVNTYSDYATIKYDSNGVQQWEARYNGLGNAGEYARDLVIDSSGNVYVTGASMISSTDYDYATIKYDNNGNELWVARYDGLGNTRDEAQALAKDEEGNVYVTGISIISSSDYDYATIKYNGSGVLQWKTRYNGPGNALDNVSDLVIDSSENIYVTGSSVGSGTNSDYTTIKYSQNNSTYSIEATAGSNGTISPDGTIIVSSGDDQTFTITADDGFCIGDVLVDGTSVGVVGSYTFKDITANHTISATFMTREQAVSNLIDMIDTINLDTGTKNQLLSSLIAAQNSFEAGNDTAAWNQLNAFINKISSQIGKKMTEEEAELILFQFSDILGPRLVGAEVKICLNEQGEILWEGVTNEYGEFGVDFSKFILSQKKSDFYFYITPQGSLQTFEIKLKISKQIHDFVLFKVNEIWISGEQSISLTTAESNCMTPITFGSKTGKNPL